MTDFDLPDLGFVDEHADMQAAVVGQHDCAAAGSANGRSHLRHHTVKRRDDFGIVQLLLRFLEGELGLIQLDLSCRRRSIRRVEQSIQIVLRLLQLSCS